MKLGVVLALLACIGLFARTGHAQMSDSERKATARAAFIEGVELQDQGKAAAALARFEAAQALFDAPTHLLHIAQCQALTGKLVEAAETYETLVRKQLGDQPSEAFVRAQAQAKTELSALRARLPSLRFTTQPEPSELVDLRIQIGDRAIPIELAGIARPVNPGSYSLSATARGWATPAPVVVTIREQEAKSVELVLKRGARPVATATSSTPATTEAPPEYGLETEPAAHGASSGGLLFGVRPALFVPVGRLSERTPLHEVARFGPGIGLDVIGRFARRFLVGGTFEYAAPGSPDPSRIERDATADVSTRMIYAGALVGVMPNVDKLTFVADLGAGVRVLSQEVAYRSSRTEKYSFSGLEVGLGAGLSIPAGALRIVPKLSTGVGVFGSRSCLSTPTSRSYSDCRAPSAAHAILGLSLGLYYHVDLGKGRARSAASSAVVPSSW